METEKNSEMKAIFIPPETHKRLTRFMQNLGFEKTDKAIDYLIESYALSRKYGVIEI